MDKYKIKNSISNVLYIALLIVAFWSAVSNIVQALKCPKMTYTELFLHIPKSFVGDWNDCSEY